MKFHNWVALCVSINVKEQILTLRQEGLSYREIAQKLGITRFKVEYYANPNKKDILRKAAQKYRNKIPIQKKVANFHSLTPPTQRAGRSFSYKEFLQKVGSNPTCYLSGVSIDLSKPETYSIDHIQPICQGGSNDIDNAGLVTTEMNQLKMHRTPAQLVQLCEQVLSYSRRSGLV